MIEREAPPESPSSATVELEIQLRRVAAQLRQVGEAYGEMLGPDRLQQLRQVCEAIDALRR